MSVPALQFQSVCKAYAGANALGAFTLQINAGECFGLVGANGAGKTTAIKCLLDFCELDSGNIDIFGVAHHHTNARARLAYLPERFNPPHYLTGRDFLQYMAKMHRTTYQENAAAAVLQELDLAMVALDKPVRAYSKGMNQKLGLAACVLSRKDLYILDEPTSGLDPRARPAQAQTESPARRRQNHFLHLTRAFRCRGNVRPRRGHRRRQIALRRHAGRTHAHA